MGCMMHGARGERGERTDRTRHGKGAHESVRASHEPAWRMAEWGSIGTDGGDKGSVLAMSRETEDRDTETGKRYGGPTRESPRNKGEN